MTESTVTLVKFCGALMLFLIGLSYTVFFLSDLEGAFDGVVQGSETVYNSGLEIPEEILWTGDQVVGKLYKLMEEGVPVVVDGVVFVTDEDVINQQGSVILGAEYKQHIDIDQDGNVSGISFSF